MHTKYFYKVFQNMKIIFWKVLIMYYNYGVLYLYKMWIITHVLNNYLKFLGKRFRFDLLSDQKSDVTILTNDQLQNFLDQPLKNKSFAGLRDKALLEILFSTGLKVGQIIKIQTEQIDDLKKEIILDQQLHLNLKPLAWFHLEKYLAERSDDGPWLFINLDRANKSSENHLTVRSVERIVDKYTKQMETGIKINPQILRNTLATQLKQEGAQQEHIKKALHFQTKIGAKNYLDRI